MKYQFNKVDGVPNLWHGEVDGDPYFMSAVNPRHWRVTRQLNMGDTYRAHQVTFQRSGKSLCDCEGFRRAGKCRHIDMVNEVKT